MICAYAPVDPEKHKQLVTTILNDKEWSLLSLQDMYLAGNSLEDIVEVIPFRGTECARSRRCCGMCTRQCKTRCIQDCLHRLYMWRQLVESTPKDQLESIPLSIRLAVNQQFDSQEALSLVVGEIISRKTNPRVDKYMVESGSLHTGNPYKLDYAPVAEYDSITGKRVVNEQTGQIKILEWPKSGLCPFCLAKNTVDRRYGSHEY